MTSFEENSFRGGTRFAPSQWCEELRQTKSVDARHSSQFFASFNSPLPSSKSGRPQVCVFILTSTTISTTRTPQFFRRPRADHYFVARRQVTCLSPQKYLRSYGARASISIRSMSRIPRTLTGSKCSFGPINITVSRDSRRL